MLFKIHRASHAQSLTVASIVINVPAGRFLFIRQAEAIGMDTTAAAGAVHGIYDVGTNGSGGTPTSLTIQRVDANPDSYSLPTGFTAVFGYTTEPTVGNLRERLAFQPLGGRAKYIALPGGELAFWKSTAYQIAFRGVTGTPNVELNLEVELL